MAKFKIDDAELRRNVRALGETLRAHRRRSTTPLSEAERMFNPRSSLAVQERKDFERGSVSPLGGRAEWKR
jgi:hypothetical protein